MAIREFWFQIENRPSIIRSADTDFHRQETAGSSQREHLGHRCPEFAHRRSACKPERNPRTDQDREASRPWVVKEALILRRYRPPTRVDWSDAWTVADDFELDSWNLCNPDLFDGGAPTAIHGSSIECHAGDLVIVHFRNQDLRNRIVIKTIDIELPFGGALGIPTPFNEPLPILERTHCLHPHGLQRSGAGHPDRTSPDPEQPVGVEAAFWEAVGVTAFKMGDRVPPGGTFTYTWDTVGRSIFRRSRSMNPVRFLFSGTLPLAGPGCY